MGRELVFATFLAPNIRPVYEYVAARVGEELGLPTRLVTGDSSAQLRSADIDFAFVCGLPYVRLRRENPALLEAIAAPVVAGDRYAGRPVYFSDVIVPAGSPTRSFEDLRDGSWAYNEPDSHSGYLITLFHLYEMGVRSAFFGRSEMTGFHQESVHRVAQSRVGGSAIDSQVLDVELKNHPELAEKIRVVATLGPSTIQPLVATARVPAAVRAWVQDIVASMGSTDADRAALAQGLVERFVAVDDSSYEDIRAMLAAVESAGLRLE